MKTGWMFHGALGLSLLLSHQLAWSQEAEQRVPTLYVSINMAAPVDQKVTLKVVEAPRPQPVISQASNPRYITVMVHNRWKRNYADKNDPGPLVGVIDAENPFLPMVDAALLKSPSEQASDQEHLIAEQNRQVKDPKALIGKLKLVMRLSLEGREDLLESIRTLEKNPDVKSPYSKALLEFYIKVIQHGALAAIDKFELANTGSKQERHASQKEAKRIFFETIKTAIVKDAVIDGLLKDYAEVVQSLNASKGEIK